MNAPSWDRKEFFQRALDQPLDIRAQWLEERCGRDAALLAEVQSLLATHDAAGSVADQAAGDLRQGSTPAARAPGTATGRHAGRLRDSVAARRRWHRYRTRNRPTHVEPRTEVTS